MPDTALYDHFATRSQDFLSGSGWDADWSTHQNDSGLILSTEYHYMNGENGMYIGWIPVWYVIRFLDDDLPYLIESHSVKPIWWVDTGEAMNPDYDQYIEELHDMAIVNIETILKGFKKDAISSRL